MHFSKLLRYYSIKTAHWSFSHCTTGDLKMGLFDKAKAAQMVQKDTRHLKV